ncbi:MAG: alcohol acetyltransferase, partial [Cyanobacteria bacterium J06636_16]
HQLGPGLHRLLVGSQVFYPYHLRTTELFSDLLVEPNKSPLTKKAPLTIEVSNVGKIDIPVNYGPLELEEIRFMPSQGMFGGVFFAAVATFRDRMAFNFVFSEPSLSRATVEGLIDDALSYLMDSSRVTPG